MESQPLQTKLVSRSVAVTPVNYDLVNFALTDGRDNLGQQIVMDFLPKNMVSKMETFETQKKG